MTIKQQGGVFGRNPTFQDVSVDGALDLADGVKASFGTSDDLQIFHSGTNSYIQDLGTGSLYIQSAPNVLIGSGTQTNMIVADGGAVTLRHNGLNKLATTAAGISVTGNVAVTDGGGIDFSATAGTGTSELLDDYEEGTWTPVLSDAASGGNLATGTFDGIYTKVGNKVTVWLSASNINTSGMTGTSDLYIQDLPFASGSGASKSTGAVRSDSITFANYLVSIVSSSASTMLIYNIGSNVADTPLNVQDITSGSGDIFTSVTYFV